MPISTNNLKFDIRFIAISSIVFLLIGAYFSTVYFNNISQKETNKLLSKIGEVAGEQDKTKVESFSSEELPIIPNSEIVSIDRQKDRLTLTLEIDRPDSEISSYYDDYLFQNGWIEMNLGEYKKNNRKMEIEINDGVIYIILTENQ